MSRMSLRSCSTSSEDEGRALTSQHPKNWVIKTDACKIVKIVTNRFVVKAEGLGQFRRF